MSGAPERGLAEANRQSVRGHRFHSSLLREYDIRGVVGETLGIEDARAIGRAFGEIVRSHGHRVVVGFDGRHSSPALEAAAIEGLRSRGLEIKRVGLGPTPMVYFGLHHLDAAAGLMITGSHNPPDQNGFKLVLRDGPVFGEALQALGALAAGGLDECGSGTVSDDPVLDAYIERIVRDYDGDSDRSLKVAWDAGNGAAGDALAKLTSRIPGRHVLLNATIDGDFPAHHPDPTVAVNLAQLQETVLAEGCDLGIAFDGDGDRIGVVDGAGHILWGDQILALLARDVLATLPGSTIIGDVKASQTLFDDIAKHGGVPLMWKSGYALLRSKQREVGSPLAGEMAGHIFFADRFYGHDDALYAAVRFLSMAARSRLSVADMRDSLPRAFSTPELRFPCADDEKFSAVERVKRGLDPSSVGVVDIDGVRVSNADGWWLLRASNTQPVLVARCEAGDEVALARVKRHLIAALAAAAVAGPTLLGS